MEEEFIRNQERLKPQEEKHEVCSIYFLYFINICWAFYLNAVPCNHFILMISFSTIKFLLIIKDHSTGNAYSENHISWCIISFQFCFVWHWWIVPFCYIWSKHFLFDNNLNDISLTLIYFLQEERSKVDELRGSPMSVGTLEEIIDDNHAIVSTSVGSEHYVSILSFVDKDQLEPGCSVLLNHKVFLFFFNYFILVILTIV